MPDCRPGRAGPPRPASAEAHGPPARIGPGRVLRRGAVALCLAAASAWAGPAPPVSFEAVILAEYTPSPGMGTGVAVADFDDDGAPDIFVPTGGGTPNLLFRNRGDGTFDEVAAGFGLDDTRQARSALWVDYDGDDDLDLFVGRDCFAAGFDGITQAVIDAAGDCGAPVVSLYEQRPGGFVDISDSVGLLTPAGALNNTYHAGGLSAADISGDGLPDLYFARWQTIAELYISDTLDLDRREVGGYSLGSGLTAIGDAEGGHWQALFHDFDADGRLDLFVNVDFSFNRLWMNEPGLDLIDRAADAGLDTAFNEMGMAAGDYDNDGDVDLYLTNIHDWPVHHPQISRNRLYRNDTGGGPVAFTDRAQPAGVGATGWGWGATWLDADNDGDLDLAVTNGYCQPAPDFCGPEYEFDASRFFVNPGDGSAFTEVGASVGFDDTLIGAGLVAADLDGDGRLDLLQTAIDQATGPSEQPLGRRERLTLYFNRAPDDGAVGRFARVAARPDSGDTRALGARVELELFDGRRLTRLVTAGESWMSQAPAVLHFGIPAGAEVRRMKVRWPGGGRTVLPPPPEGATTRIGAVDLVLASGFEG